MAKIRVLIFAVLFCQIINLVQLTSSNCKDVNCLSCDSSRCLKCKGGYSQNDVGGCWQCGDFCASCIHYKEYCNTCQSGYVLNSIYT